MPDALQAPIFQTFRIGQEKFLATPTSAGGDSWHVVNDAGDNYGGWGTIDQFIGAYKTGKYRDSYGFGELVDMLRWDATVGGPSLRLGKCGLHVRPLRD